MSQQQLYKLKAIVSFRAPKRSSSGKSVLYKNFREGQEFTGYLANGSGTPDTMHQVFKTPDGFTIQMNNIHVGGKIGVRPQQRSSSFSGQIEEAQIVNDRDYIDKNQMSRATKLIQSTAGGTRLVDTLKSRSKTAINGGLVGAGVGLIYALAKQKNKWLFLTIGAVGGYILGNSYTNFFKDDNKK
jgi:hypothetical protein